MHFLLYTRWGGERERRSAAKQDSTYGGERERRKEMQFAVLMIK